MGGGKHGGYASEAQRKAVHATKADGGAGNPNKMVSPLDFGAGGASIAGIPTSMFGSLGANPSINSLTNANAMAAQQAAARQTNRMVGAAAQPVGSGMIGDISQNVMDASMPTFDPASQNMAMGIFGAGGARNRSLYPSAIMKHADKEIRQLEKNIKAAEKRLEKYGSSENSDPEVKYDVEEEIKAARERIAELNKEHEGSPAKKGETYEEFKKRTGKTSMKDYLRENPKGSK